MSNGLGAALKTSAASKTAVGWTRRHRHGVEARGKADLHAEFGRLNGAGVRNVNGGAFVNTFNHTASLNEDILRIGINR